MAEDVGGNSGRTIEFNPETCMLQIRTVNKGIQMYLMIHWLKRFLFSGHDLIEMFKK